MSLDTDTGKIVIIRNGKKVYGKNALRILNTIQDAYTKYIEHIDSDIHKEFGWVQTPFEHIILSNSRLNTLVHSGVPKQFLASLYFNLDASHSIENENFNNEFGELAFNLRLYRKNQQQTRRKVLYQLKKGNTHKAIDNLLGGYDFPKSIRQSLFTHTFYNKEVYELVDSTIKLIGVDNTKKLIDISRDVFYLITVLMKLIGYGFSYKKLITAVNKRDPLLVRSTPYYVKCYQVNYDIINMVEVLTHFPEQKDAIKVTSQHTDLTSYHNYLVNLFNLVVNHNPLYNTPIKAPLPTYSSADYLIRSVENTNELFVIGVKMNHCVAAYAEKHYHEKCFIYVVVDKDDNYLACIEIEKNKKSKELYIAQAKMHYNRPVVTHPQINNLIKRWCDSLPNKINYSYCNDIN